jgi:hypothetical protein
MADDDWTGPSITREFTSQQRQIDALWRAMNGMPAKVDVLSVEVHACTDGLENLRSDIKAQGAEQGISRRFLVVALTGFAGLAITAAGVLVAVFA